MKLRNDESGKIKSLYFNNMDWELVQMANWLIKRLPDNAEIDTYAVCNAFERKGEGFITHTVEGWFTFTLNGWYVEFMPCCNWLCEGIDLLAYPITDDYYKRTCYPYNVKWNDNKDLFLELLSNPESIYKAQEHIERGKTKKEREDILDYVSRKMPIKHITYTV